MSEANPQIPDFPNGGKLTREEIERFFAKVNKDGPLPDQNNPHYAGLDRCWEWTGSLAHGYGSVTISGRTRMAHRVGYEMAVGPLGKMCACHKCDNPRCVNPAHMFPGTRADNSRDQVSKGRRRVGPTLNPSFQTISQTKTDATPFSGERNASARLTGEMVIAMRELHALSKLPQVAIARMFGVEQTTVSSIVLRKTWRHI